MKTKILVTLVCTTLVVLGSCQKETVLNQDPTLNVVTVTDLDADANKLNKFTFYNLREGKIVPNSDSLSNNWDIAFKATTILINGGTNRVGNGGAAIFIGLFNDLKTVSNEVVFNPDTDNALAIPTGSGNGWYNYNPAALTISPLAGRVLLIKTADERYAKLEILSYYKGAPALPTSTDSSRYYTFRYVYQPDGSKLLF